MGKPIYLDYASTTPVDERVASKMMEFMTVGSNFGNPASRSHSFGWQADEAVELARSHVANLVNCDPREIVWTSGATEADNLAIKGIANFYKSKGKHIITSKIEHKAVLDPCRQQGAWALAASQVGIDSAAGVGVQALGRTASFVLA